MRGLGIDEKNLGFEGICEAVLGEGHFLGGAQTLEVMERDYFYPTLADREHPRTWEENGALDAWAVAKVRAWEILEKHHPEYLDPEQDKRIRDAFNILA